MEKIRNSNCSCAEKACQHNGYCDDCRAAHVAKGSATACDQRKAGDAS